MTAKWTNYMVNIMSTNIVKTPDFILGLMVVFIKKMERFFSSFCESIDRFALFAFLLRMLLTFTKRDFF